MIKLFCEYEGCRKPGRLKLEIDGFIILYCKRHYHQEKREFQRKKRNKNL